MTPIESDILYLQNTNTDVLSPSQAMTDITSIVCMMLEENIAHVKKNGQSEKATQSRKRLLQLLDITETFNQVSNTNAGLKLHNNRLLAENQQLKNQLKEIERQERIAESM